MELFSPLKIGWLNGWIPIVAFYAAYLILLKVFPPETVKRMYDNTGWTDDQARYARLGLPFALGAMILILFTPLAIGKADFWVGLALLSVRLAMNHFRILGEERALDAQYGEAYLQFKKAVPRYLLFF